MSTAKRTLSKPFIYGSCSYFIGKKSDEQKYEWFVYLRGVDNEDLSYLVKSVTFTLHESFAPNTVRVVENPPFQVCEQGWGEFVVLIRVLFQDPTLKPIDFTHNLKLFHEPNAVQTTSTGARKPVVVERYDEFVFVDPSDEFAAKVAAGPAKYLELAAAKPDEHFSPADRWAREENAQYTVLAIAHDSVLKQILRLKNELTEAENEIVQYKELINRGNAGNPNLINMQHRLSTSTPVAITPTTPSIVPTTTKV